MALPPLNRLISSGETRLIGLLLFAFLSACAPVAPRLEGVRIAPEVGDALLADWRESTSGIAALQGLAKVKAKTPEGSLSGTQVVVAARPALLRAETLSPFGTPLLLLAADGDRLGVSVPPRGVYYTGRASPANLGRFFRIPLRLEDLVDILLYRAPLPGATEQRTLALDAGGWSVERRSAGRHQELRFDGQRRLVELRYFAKDELFLEVIYGGFEGAVNLPRQVSIALPELDTRASLDFEEVTFNGSPRPELFRLVPPAGATVVSLDDL